MKTNIASERKRLGITQSELAERVGVNAKTVSNWERHANKMPADKIAELADIFNCSIDYLLCKSDERLKRHAVM